MEGLSGGGHNMLVMELSVKLLEVDGDRRIVCVIGIGRC